MVLSGSQSLLQSRLDPGQADGRDARRAHENVADGCAPREARQVRSGCILRILVSSLDP